MKTAILCCMTLLLPVCTGLAEERVVTSFSELAEVYARSDVRITLTIDDSSPLGHGRILTHKVVTPIAAPDRALTPDLLIATIENSMRSVVGVIDESNPSVVHFISRSLILNPTLSIPIEDWEFAGSAGDLVKAISDRFKKDPSETRSPFTAVGTNDRLPTELPDRVSLLRGDWTPRQALTKAALQFSNDAYLWIASFKCRSATAPSVRFGSSHIAEIEPQKIGDLQNQSSLAEAIRNFTHAASPGDDFRLIGEDTYAPVSLLPGMDPLFLFVYARITQDATADERAVVIGKLTSAGIQHLMTMRSQGAMTPSTYEGYDLVSTADRAAEFTMRWRFTGNRGSQISVNCQYTETSLNVLATRVCRFSDGKWNWAEADFSLEEGKAGDVEHRDAEP
ncbi:MAG: hypothetical protein ACOCVS_00760 [Planctomycetota bacterium]